MIFLFIRFCYFLLLSQFFHSCEFMKVFKRIREGWSLQRANNNHVALQFVWSEEFV